MVVVGAVLAVVALVVLVVVVVVRGVAVVGNRRGHMAAASAQQSPSRGQLASQKHVCERLR